MARTTALLFSFSAVALFLLALQPPPSPQNQALLLGVLDRFLANILRFATRTNMVLLCHAILLLILRDAGVLAAPARRRAAAADSDAPQTSARSIVVWQRRPQDKATNGRRRLVKRQQRRSPRPWQPEVSSREIVLADKDHAPAATAKVGERNLDRRIVAVAEETAELADDRRIEEFIANQWSMMRQESLQLVRAGSSSTSSRSQHATSM